MHTHVPTSYYPVSFPFHELLLLASGADPYSMYMVHAYTLHMYIATIECSVLHLAFHFQWHLCARADLDSGMLRTCRAYCCLHYVPGVSTNLHTIYLITAFILHTCIAAPEYWVLHKYWGWHCEDMLNTLPLVRRGYLRLGAAGGVT